MFHGRREEVEVVAQERQVIDGHRGTLGGAVAADAAHFRSLRVTSSRRIDTARVRHTSFEAMPSRFPQFREEHWTTRVFVT
jgi:hypothetical protein